MKDKIIDYHPIKGFITFGDLIADLKIILKNFQFDDEMIASLFTCDIESSLENIIYVLQDRL